MTLAFHVDHSREQMVNTELHGADHQIRRIKREKEARVLAKHYGGGDNNQPIPSGGKVNGCVRQDAPA